MKQNTKAAIMNSFKDLLNKHSIDKVTVKEICDNSYVNRHTSIKRTCSGLKHCRICLHDLQGRKEKAESVPR